MNAVEAIKTSLELSRQWFLGLASDMKDAPLATATGSAGKHTLWLVGHVVHAEAGMVSGWIMGEPTHGAESDPLFGIGSKPIADASAYPSLDELFARYEKVRARTLEVIASLTEADLERPSHAPPHVSHIFGTVGKCLLMLCNHTAFHAGQVADIRAALGRKPILG